ncbi:hypothetical protein BHM03_00058262 [Ensete ventricosum]|nr:hypothetical protein BHM03_00058262 [Ensete ventricosum]
MRVMAGDNDATTCNGGERCGNKDGRGGWAALEGAATTTLDLQAGRVIKSKGVVKTVTSRGGRKRAAAVRRGLRQWESIVGRQQQQRCCARQRCGRGGSDEGLATTGCALPRLADSSGREAQEEGNTVRCGRGARDWERWTTARMATACVGKMGETTARPAVGSDEASKSDEGCDRGLAGGDSGRGWAADG